MSMNLRDLSLALTPPGDGPPTPYFRTAVVVSTGATWTVTLDGVNVPANALQNAFAVAGNVVAVLTRVGAPPLVLGTIGDGTQLWTNYTPTLTQLGAVPKTVASGRYLVRRPFVFLDLVLEVSDAGGTGANQILVGLPPIVPYASFLYLGTGALYDASSGNEYRYVAQREASTSTFRLMSTQNSSIAGLGAIQFTDALAAGDVLRANFYYPYE